MDIILPIVGIIIVFGIVAAIVASRYKIAKTTEAIIVTGRNKKDQVVTTTGENGSQHSSTHTDLSGQKVVIGGGIFVWPFLQQYEKIQLKSQSIEVNIQSVPSADGILLDVEGVAIIKIGGTQEAVRLAAQRFGGNLEEIKLQTVETMSGALRGIVGRMTVLNIIGDREAFAQEAIQIAQDTLSNQGLALDSFQIRNIADDNNYLINLGRPEAAKVEKLAKIAEAEATREAEEKTISVAQNIAEANRVLDLKRAEIKSITDKSQAEAEAAYKLEDSNQKQLLLIEMQKIREQQAIVKEKELEATVRKVADANRYEKEQQAEALKTAAILNAESEKVKTITQAEAKAQQDALTGQGRISLADADAASKEAEARGMLAIATAQAAAIKATGQAEADAILAKGEAEAEAMQKRADAYANYGQAALLETVIKALPAIAQPFADAYSGISNLSIVDSDGSSKLSHAMASNISQVKEILKTTTGFDIDNVLTGFTGGNELGLNNTDNASTDK